MRQAEVTAGLGSRQPRSCDAMKY